MCALWLLWLCALLPVSAMRGDTVAALNPDTVHRLYEFGFLPGGSVQATWSLNAPFPPTGRNAFLIAAICTEEEVAMLLSYFSDPFHTVCPSLGKGMCWQTALLSETNSTLWALDTTTVSSNVDLSFLVINCFRATAVVELSFLCLNPGGEQLSSGDIPLKTISLAFVGVWAALGGGLLLASAAAAARYTAPAPEEVGDDLDAQAALSSPVRPLHWALVMCAALMSASATSSWLVWTRASSAGVFDATLGWIDVALWDAASASMLLLLLALGRGWQVTRLKLQTLETRAVLALTAMYAASWALWEWEGGFFALFGLVASYVLITRYLFYSLTRSLRVLALFRAVASSLTGGEGERRALLSAGGRRSGVQEEYEGEAKARRASLAEVPRPNIPQEAMVVDAATARLLAGAAYGGHFSPPSPTASQGKRYGSVAPPPEEMEMAPLSATRPSSDDPLLPVVQGGGSNLVSRGIQCVSAAAASAATASMGMVDALTGVSRPARGQGSEGGADGGMREGGLSSRQSNLLHRLRSLVVLYLSLDVFLNVWDVMDSASPMWVQFALEHALGASMLLFLAISLRPRADPAASLLFDPRGYLSGSADVLEPLVGAPDVPRSEGEGGAARPWVMLRGPSGALLGAARGQPEDEPPSRLHDLLSSVRVAEEDDPWMQGSLR
jgi:hypothetical protein